MPIKAKTLKIGAKYCVSIGKIGIKKRITAKIPNFNKTPANNTEPTVGASTCASGNQIWAGNIGTLTAKANIKNNQIIKLRLEYNIVSISANKLKLDCWSYNKNKLNNRNKEPI